MLDSGFFRKTNAWRIFPLVLGLAIVAFEICSAQPPRRVVPPAPLGAPYVAVGPAANPFGPPPMALGPAPGPVMIGRPPAPFYYSAPVGAPFGYPPPAYPPVPYMVRRATPFEAVNPAVANPQTPVLAAPPTVGAPTLIEAPQAIAAIAYPAPIGNLRLTISENFLNRIVARDEQKPGDVQDFILGAQVTGRQITDTKVRLDLLPSGDKGRGAIVLNGVTQSQTTGVTPKAMVDTSSQQQFRAVKELFFDGMRFSTRHAVVFARARNQTMGAQTPFSGTLIGGIADRIAFRAAEKRQAEGEAIARDRVAERVFPEFDSNVDKQLATANDQLEEKVRPILRRTNFMPSQQQVISTDTYLGYSIQLGEESPTSSTAPLESQISKDDGVNLLVHESLLNQLVARSGLKGLKTTDQEVRSLISPYEIKSQLDDSGSSAPAFALPGMENVVTNIEFDETDPMTIKLDQDVAVVSIRATFKPAGQDVLPPLFVTIDYKTDVSGDKIVVTPGNVRVTLQNENDKSTTTAIALKLISQGLEANLSKLAVDRSLPAVAWPFGGAIPRVNIIHSQDGWAAVSIN